MRDVKGNVTIINPDGAEFAAAAAINSSGAITGTFTPNDGSVHGFVRAQKGSVATFDVPGDTNGTFATSINAKGSIAGYDVDGNDNQHGFVRAPDGTITAFDPPGSTATEVFGINARGMVAGYYFSGRAYYGFVRTSAGAFTSFDVPGNTTGTFPQGINDKGAVAGWFRDSQHVVHGFTWTP